ncbi:hypothetical protein EIP91_012358 [Steccherinum ochraceum]|uniref:Uncharacterized protein n=1 Tax=Steccherinum ochraceum TaxID=92696 RepID=A0A4R0RGQ0_9APHY|nr:hypothetical protein EIP91_012358 [Steccherinum ochraceum]
MASSQFWSPCFFTLAVLLFIAGTTRAESHTVRFDNQCGRGSPVLLKGGQVLSQGDAYTSNGPLSSAIAYLQTGNCGFNGENCAIVEMTLGNPACAGCGSSVDISLITPFENGCDGSGATCSTPDCKDAFFKPDDNQVQFACQEDNVDLLITFCGGGSSSNASAPAKPPPSSSIPHSTASSTPASPPTHLASLPAPPMNVAPTPPISRASGTATTPVVAAETTGAPTSTTTPPSCRRSTRQRRREVTSTDPSAAPEVKLGSRELYDARIRGIVQHASRARARRSF